MVRSEQDALFEVGSVPVDRPHHHTAPPAEPVTEQPVLGEPLIAPEECENPALRDTFTRQLTKRQAFLVRLGWHPLARALGRNLRLHRDAIADPTVRKGGPRCGTCVFRQLRGGAERDYPKCWLDPLKVTRGPATDVRAWWPACTEYQEDPKCQSPRTASPGRHRRK